MQVWWVIFQQVCAQKLSKHNNEKWLKLLTFHTAIAKTASTKLMEIAFLSTIGLSYLQRKFNDCIKIATKSLVLYLL